MSKELVERLRAQWAALDPADEYRSDAAEAADLIERQAARIAEIEAAMAQRDELLAACEKVRKCKAIYNMFPGKSRKSYGAVLDDAIASVKGVVKESLCCPVRDEVIK